MESIYLIQRSLPVLVGILERGNEKVLDVPSSSSRILKRERTAPLPHRSYNTVLVTLQFRIWSNILSRQGSSGMALSCIYMQYLSWCVWPFDADIKALPRTKHQLLVQEPKIQCICESQVTFDLVVSAFFGRDTLILNITFSHKLHWSSWVSLNPHC